MRDLYQGSNMFAAVLSSAFNPAKCDRKCLRCGKVKEFSFDDRR